MNPITGIHPPFDLKYHRVLKNEPKDLADIIRSHSVEEVKDVINKIKKREEMALEMKTIIAELAEQSACTSVITIDPWEFIKEIHNNKTKTMKRFKNQFAVTGTPLQLMIFEDALLKAGFLRTGLSVLDYRGEGGGYAHYLTSGLHVGSNLGEFMCASNDGSASDYDCLFGLPEQAEAALKYATEKVALFTTHDGVKIYSMHDILYGINSNVKSDVAYFQYSTAPLSAIGVYDRNYKWFSTGTARMEYVNSTRTLTTHDGMVRKIGDKVYFLPGICVRNYSLNCNEQRGIAGSGAVETLTAAHFDDKEAASEFYSDGGLCFSSKQAAKDWINKHKVITTCDDGKDLHLGDFVWIIGPSGATTSYKIGPNHNKYPGYKYFSTEKALADYQYENKPIYSQSALDFACRKTDDQVKKIKDLENKLTYAEKQLKAIENVYGISVVGNKSENIVKVSSDNNNGLQDCVTSPSNR